MKTLTEMKKVHCMRRFSLFIIALGLTIGFSSCGSDDADIPKFSLNDANGNYAGKMQTVTIQPQNRSTETPETGVDVTAEVKDNNVILNKFPVADLIKSILGDNEASAGIIGAIGDVNYQVAYQGSFNDKQDVINMELDPKTLEISFKIPSTKEEGGDEAPEFKVKVTITADQQGTFAYANHKLNFTLHATEVFLNGSETPFEGFPASSFKFDLNKK